MAANDSQSYPDLLAQRRELITQRVEQACSRAGRDPKDVTVMAISKTVDVDAVRQAMRVGWTDFGENRPQELVAKTTALGQLAGDVCPRFDMIGNLQKNKINQVLGRAELIHSISSVHLAQAVSTRALAREMVASVLLEVNVSGEASKSGMSVVDALTGLDEILGLEGIEVRGLMTMAPRDDATEARRTFEGLRLLAERMRSTSGLALPVLSCGMSDDFEIAVEEGSTLVRLGRIVFSQDYNV